MSEEKNQSCNELSFDTLGINDKILRGVYSYGFEKPSKIQDNAIPKIISGVDVIGQSQSGTGKTGAFAIGTLCRIDETNNNRLTNFKVIKNYKNGKYCINHSNKYKKINVHH